MPLWPIIVVAVTLFVVWSVIPGVKHRQYRRSIRERTPAQTEWASEFPSAMPTVEQVLVVFCDAFLLNGRYRFHLRPDDKVIDVYKGTTGPVADEMQLERLVIGIDESFGLDLANVCNESLTLRDIVALVLERGTITGSASVKG